MPAVLSAGLVVPAVKLAMSWRVTPNTNASFLCQPRNSPGFLPSKLPEPCFGVSEIAVGGGVSPIGR